ncbi:MAG: CHASE domain-containing protein, partial [Pyrinomonadaceae bacterium]
MKSPTPKSRFYRRHSKSTPYLGLAGGLLFTFVVSYHLFSVAEAEDGARFRALAQEVHYSIESRLETYTALLRAGTGLFAASETVNQDEFKSFIQRLDLAAHYPGVRVIGFSLRFRPEEMATLIESRKRAGMSDFRVWPESQSDEYHSIIFLEPLDGRNKPAVGYDMFTEPIRRAAMERARDTGLPAASGRVTLIQESEAPIRHPGFLIYAPVYQNGLAISNETERQRALVGFVYGQFSADDFFRGIVENEVFENLELQVYDGSGINDRNLLYRSNLNDDLTPATHEPRFVGATNLDVAGNPWTIAFISRPGLDRASGRNSVPYMFAGGTLLSFLFFGVSRSQLKSRASAEQAAAELRESEATVRKTLVERERAEDALREGEERYRELVENANDIVYSLDLEGKITSVNKAAESITGYSRNEIVNLKLTDIMSPESAEASRQMLNRTLSGEQRTNYELDIRAKDGRTLTLEISSGLVRKNGQAVGVQGVARDITVRRRAEEALREADQRALAEYERLLERISALAQALGTARELLMIFRALRDFTTVSVPCDGLFISLYDPIRDVRTACYGWGDGQEVDTSQLPPMPVTATGLNSRA